MFLNVFASSGTPLSSSAVNADRLPLRARTVICCCICVTLIMLKISPSQQMYEELSRLTSDLISSVVVSNKSQVGGSHLWHSHSLASLTDRPSYS